MPPRLRSKLHCAILCRLGRHGPRVTPTGETANYCGYCAFAFRPDAWKRWIVTLRNGETHEVAAINEWHAGSVVVYGDGAGAIDGRTGQAIGEVKVHRENIVSITPVQTAAGQPSTSASTAGRAMSTLPTMEGESKVRTK